LPPFKTPRYPDEWAEVDSELVQRLLPAVINATSPDEKDSILCQGIYEYMATKFGVQRAHKSKKTNRRRHERKLKKLTREKNAARKDLRRAKRQAQDEEAVRSKKASLQAKVNLEAFKARRECARSFWRFASNLLDKEESSKSPSFNQETAETFFTKVYDSHPKQFSWPSWLPEPPASTTPFDDQGPITLKEIEKVIKHSRKSSSPGGLQGLLWLFP